MLNDHQFKNGIDKILIDFPALVYTIDLDLIYRAIKQKEANVIGGIYEICKRTNLQTIYYRRDSKI